MRDSIKNLFKADPASGDVSPFRLHLMRVIFAGTFLFVGTGAWKAVLTHRVPWDPLHGVAWSFWAAYATLMLLGLRYPLKQLPLLLLQFFYKLVWLFAVAYPLWSSGELAGSPARTLTTIFIIAVAVDLAVIPWPYALRSFVLKSATH